MALRLGRSDITADESHLRIHADTRVIGHCTGTFENKAVFLIQDGDLTVKQLGAADYIKAEPHQVAEVLAALNATFGEALKAPRAIINDAGKFVLLDTAPPTDLEASLREGAKTIAGVASKVLKATAEATRDAREAVGITGLTVRKNGMVSMARARLENGEPIANIAAELTTDFHGLPDLEHLVGVAIREAQDDKRNKAEDYGAVRQFKLDAAIVVRLEAGEDPDDIRNALRPTLVRVPGRRIERSDGEVESILTIAFECAEVLEAARATSKARKDSFNGVVKGARNLANEAMGTTARIVRENGMVTRARALLEAGSTPRDITTAFETEFRGAANLVELTRVALKEAADNKANKAAADALVKRRALATLVADRLSMGETADDIEANLRPDYLEYRTPDGFTIQRSDRRSDREVDEIMDSAMTQGIALHERRKTEKVGVLVSRARSNGMISMTRFLLQEGQSDLEIRETLRTSFAGTAQLGDLINVALTEARNNAHNLNLALVTVQRLHLDREIANRLARGEEEADIRPSIESQIESEVIHGVNIERGNGEIREILNAAFEGAEQINAKREREKEANLIRTANDMGLVIGASYDLNQLSHAPDQVERRLIRDFPIVGIRDLARVAIQEAQDRDKVTASLRRLLQSNNEADRILAERAAGRTLVDICVRLNTTYRIYTSPSGATFPRCDRDMDALYDEAEAQADALEVKRAAEVVKARNAANTKNTVKAWVPGTEQAAWDKKLVDSGTIRFIRQEREVPSCDEDVLRTQVISRLAGESDPEGMADYALGRASDTNFNTKAAENYAFLHRNKKDPAKPTEPSLQEAIQTRMAAGEDDATIENAILSLIKEPVPDTLSSAERRDIAKALVRSERSKQKWERRGNEAEAFGRRKAGESWKWTKNHGWDTVKSVAGYTWDKTKTAAKYSALGLAIAGVGTAAAVVGAGALGLYGLKKVGPYALNATGHLFSGGLGVVKAVGESVIVNPLKAAGRVVSSPFIRAFQAGRWGWNYPKPAVQKEVKGFWSPFTWMRNKTAQAWSGLKGGSLALAAGALFSIYGAGEGVGNAFSVDLMGADATIPVPEFLTKVPHHPAPAAPKGAKAAPAKAEAAGGHGGHGGH